MSGARRGHPSDILVVPANANRAGSDYVIADLHGNHEVFSALDEHRKKASDRIFLAGDLVDRGDGNVEIIRAIVSNNSDVERGRIYSVRGNHEQLCLETINALNWLIQIKLYSEKNPTMMLILYALKKQSSIDSGLKYLLKNKYVSYFLKTLIQEGKTVFDDYSQELKMPKKKYLEMLMKHESFKEQMDTIYDGLINCQSALSLHEVNGGKWLIDLYVDEMTNSKIVIDLEGDELIFSEDSDIAMIQDYMRSLPYIIHVEGESPFNVVHADMPISTKKLLRRASEGKGLTEKEREYALWARPLSGSEIKINKVTGCRIYSVPVFVGHTIDGGVRPETNTMNLDVAAYVRDSTLMVKVPENKVMIVASRNTVDNVDEDVVRIASNVQSQLDRQKKLKERRDRHQAKATVKKPKPPGLFVRTAAVNDSELAVDVCAKKKNR